MEPIIWTWNVQWKGDIILPTRAFLSPGDRSSDPQAPRVRDRDIRHVGFGTQVSDKCYLICTTAPWGRPRYSRFIDEKINTSEVKQLLNTTGQTVVDSEPTLVWWKSLRSFFIEEDKNQDRCGAYSCRYVVILSYKFGIGDATAELVCVFVGFCWWGSVSTISLCLSWHYLVSVQIHSYLEATEISNAGK